MDFKQVMRVLVNPHWTPQPSQWTGLQHSYRSQQTGQFNLAWWALGLESPPAHEFLYVSPRIWAHTAGTSFVLEQRTLEHHASILTLAQFDALLARNRRLLREHQGFHPLHRLEHGVRRTV